jgi:hypothetical protein
VTGHDLAHAPFDHVLHRGVEGAHGAVDEGGGGMTLSTVPAWICVTEITRSSSA